MRKAALVVAVLATATVFALPVVAAAAEAPANPTYTKDIAPILFERCVSCHREGEIAPMSFMSYKEVRPWARAIKSKVVSREMPPWHADRAVSVKFKNDPSLTQEQIDTIAAWVDQGAPMGAEADMPSPPQFAEGWQHPEGREPDYVIPLPVAYDLPAEGGIPYVNFNAKVPFEEDIYAEAVETRPGNRAVVHHITVNPVDFPEPPPPGPEFAEIGATSGNGSGRRGLDGAEIDEEEINRIRRRSSLVGLFTPGQGFERFEPGYGLRVSGGPNTYFRFNMHYQLTGRPETDRSSVGVWEAREPVKYEMLRNGGVEGTVIAEGEELIDGVEGLKATGTYAVIPMIPAGADNFKVVGVTPFTKDTRIYQLNPHAHLRGKDFDYKLVYPDGSEQMLLSVPAYDFNWQLIYILEEPFVAPAGSKLQITAHYDNSPKNRYNPAPERDVFWAEQSWEEMFVPFVMYTDDVEEEVKETTQDN